MAEAFRDQARIHLSRARAARPSAWARTSPRPIQEARNVFAEVDEALGQKLSTIMFEGPDETLRLTENAQPALMAVSVAVTRVLESRGVALKNHAAFVAGHSLGEYSALAAAGAFSLGDAARLLKIRGAGHAAGRAGRAGRHGGDPRPRPRSRPRRRQRCGRWRSLRRRQ